MMAGFILGACVSGSPSHWDTSLLGHRTQNIFSNTSPFTTTMTQSAAGKKNPEKQSCSLLEREKKAARLLQNRSDSEFNLLV